jgi:hypothetical protein
VAVKLRVALRDIVVGGTASFAKAAGGIKITIFLKVYVAIPLVEPNDRRAICEL